MARFAPRIHVLLASDAPLGVIIRRGPSKRVCTMLWDRRRDQFHLGQWLKGRIYERRSDLSPDGKYLIYFAMNGKWESETRGSWTAISRAPYLKAVALFAKGDGWHGGGLFTGRRTYWLNDGWGHVVLKNTTAVIRDTESHPSPNYRGGECPGVYYPRLARDGWQFVERVNVGKWKDLDLFDKPAGAGWTLRKIAHSEVDSPPGKGCYWDQHQLIGDRSATCSDFPDWEWAELDGKRLVWAAGGKLFAGDLGRKGLTNESELYDFTQMEFTPVEAPY